MYQLKAGDNLLIIVNKPDDVHNIKVDKENVNVTSMVATEINSTDLKPSPFDYVIYKGTFETIISNGFLPKILSMQKPGSVFAICDVGDKYSKIEYELKINGHVNITQSEDGFIYCNKPNYEVGSSAKLNLKAKPAKAVWKIDDTVEDDMIDPDNLLDEDDLKKPDASSLRVCASTGKRKACKDCSCGLADELAEEKKETTVNTENAKSSCGSCYLGDAFRCATCPYLGMPAFKPGEKIQLAGNLLKSDI